MSLPENRPTVDAQTIARIKGDQRYLVCALEEAGITLHEQAPRIEGDACCCPFHFDTSPSGSMHQVRGPNATGEWLFTCHACCDRGGQWNQLNRRKPSNTGDAIAVVRAAHARAGRDMTFPQACANLVSAFERRYGRAAQVTISHPPPLPTNSAFCTASRGTARQRAVEAHERLMRDPNLLDRLWQTRAVDAPTVERFNIGHRVDHRGREWWVFPIGGLGEGFEVNKLHAADGQEPKSNWDPAGAKQGNPMFPIAVDEDGTVLIAPGEFKGLALVGLGIATFGITSGETVRHLPEEALQLLQGRSVAIAPDNDDTGRAWAAGVHQQLLAAGIDAGILNLGLTTVGEDITDWILARRMGGGQTAETVAAALLSLPLTTPTPLDSGSEDNTDGSRHLLADAPVTPSDSVYPTIGDVWQDPITWRPLERVPTHLAALDNVLHGGFPLGGMHLLAGKPGNCKTQFGLQVALNVAAHGTPVGLVSLEMDRGQIGRLALAQLSGVPRRKIDAGFSSLGDRRAGAKCQEAITKWNGLPLYLVDGQCSAYGFTRIDLGKAIARGVAKYGWQLVVLDHLGELAPCADDPSGNPLEIDKLNAFALRRIVQQHRIALLAIAQLRKAAVLKRKDSGHATKLMFSLDDVLGSTTVAYGVHTCIALRSIYRPPPDSSAVLVEVLKAREAVMPDRPIALNWEASCGRITSPAVVSADMGSKLPESANPAAVSPRFLRPEPDESGGDHE